MESVATTEKLLSLDSAEDWREWEELVSRSPYADTYYRPGYVAAYRSQGGDIRGLVLNTKSRRFLLPLVFRPLSTLSFAPEASGFDVITPYGYGGILPLEADPVSQEDGAQLVASLQAWCRVEGVVSCFLRLHSLEAQHKWFEGLRLDGVDLQYSGPTKSVELLEWDEAQAVPTALPKGRRDKMRWARRKLALEMYTCDEPASDAALQQFIEIYKGTMDRRQASGFYYFPDSYYRDLAHGLGRDMAIVIARAQEQPVAAAIFFADGKYAHFHLSGSTDEGRRLHSSAVVILKGAEWARARGCTRLHLGGGVTPNDSLFMFKDTFGGKTFEFYSLRMVAVHARYADLLERRLEAVGNPLRPNFFPEYRA
jgi:serine/alanine adding enzyme